MQLASSDSASSKEHLSFIATVKYCSTANATAKPPVKPHSNSASTTAKPTAVGTMGYCSTNRLRILDAAIVAATSWQGTVNIATETSTNFG